MVVYFHFFFPLQMTFKKYIGCVLMIDIYIYISIKFTSI